jgi:hypothetical protein
VHNQSEHGARAIGIRPDADSLTRPACAERALQTATSDP